MVDEKLAGNNRLLSQFLRTPYVYFRYALMTLIMDEWSWKWSRLFVIDNNLMQEVSSFRETIRSSRENRRCRCSIFMGPIMSLACEARVIHVTE